MKPIFVILTCILAFHSVYSQDQETIYLPFPDLPQEILNPDVKPDIIPQSNDQVNTIKETNSKKISNARKQTSSNKQNNSIKQKTTKKLNNKTKNNIENNEEPIIPIDTSEKIKNTSPEKNSEMSIVTAEDREKFQKSMEEIRRSERNDPENSIEKYKKLITQYSQPELRSKVLISIAWNYFHREKNLECLDTLLQILENEDFIHSAEYPTAIYLAARVHDRPWVGQNKNFTSRYHEIFQKNILAGRENFQNSHYRSLIEKN
ncbi:MAG: hypothetical protein JJT78_12940 [Leptospira sp.]|nr:hypothetical protein [Leptospira sp.]